MFQVLMLFEMLRVCRHDQAPLALWSHVWSLLQQGDLSRHDSLLEILRAGPRVSQCVPSSCVSPGEFPLPLHSCPLPVHPNGATCWWEASSSIQTSRVLQVWIWPNSLRKHSLHTSKSTCALLLVKLAGNCLYVTEKQFHSSNPNKSSCANRFLCHLEMIYNTETYTEICHLEEEEPLLAVWMCPERFKSSRKT